MWRTHEKTCEPCEGVMLEMDCVIHFWISTMYCADALSLTRDYCNRTPDLVAVSSRDWLCPSAPYEQRIANITNSVSEGHVRAESGFLHSNFTRSFTNTYYTNNASRPYRYVVAQESRIPLLSFGVRAAICRPWSAQASG